MANSKNPGALVRLRIDAGAQPLLYHTMRETIRQIESGRDLSPEECAVAVNWLLDEQIDPAPKAELLAALRKKGESAGEIAAFVEALLDRAIDPGIHAARLPGPMLDVCGTGGDRMEMFNVSTTAMFVLAAGGAAVVKHGNRAITSRCGGADVLEELGVPIDLPPARVAESVERTGVGFLFAPLYHPAFKVIAPVRKALAVRGIPTIFNLLGPLLNPARPPHQLIGIFAQNLLPKFGEVFATLGRKKAWAVHGTSPAGGVDEVSTLGITHVHAFENGAVRKFTIEPAELGLGEVEQTELQGGDRAENAAILTGLLDGSITGAKRDVVLLNAAAGFVVAGISPSLPEGMAWAREQISSGAAMKKLRLLQQPAR